MASVEYNLDVSNGLMPQIEALLAPPNSDDNKKRRCEKKDRISISYRRPGRAVNHDYCDSCKEGGDLICCDNCPAAFHLGCHDPPLEEEDLPVGEWLCHYCLAVANEKQSENEPSCSSKSSFIKKSDNVICMDIKSNDNEVTKDNEQVEAEEESPFNVLIRVASMMNPKQFQLPNELQCTTVLPGNYSSRTHVCNKRVQKKEGNKAGPKKLAHELDNGIVPLPAKVCFECRKSCLNAPLIQCDFCPLLFHQDCLDPPITSLPSGIWMCPNHVENVLDQKLLSSCSLSERVKLWNKFTGHISQDAVKINFLKKVHRQHPPFRYKVKLQPRNRVQVPNAVKEHYRDPPKLLAKINEPILTNDVYKPGSSIATSEEQEMWLSNVVSLQTSIANHLMQNQLLKKQSESVKSNRDNELDFLNHENSEMPNPNEETITSCTPHQSPLSTDSSQKQDYLSQKITNGEIHSSNNSRSIKINNISEVTSTSNFESSSKLDNTVVKSPNPKIVKSNNVSLNKCEVESFSSSPSPKYTLASKSTAPNSTYVHVLQMKPKAVKHSNNCSRRLNLNKFSSVTSVPVKSEDMLQDEVFKDYTKFNHLNQILENSIEDNNCDAQLGGLDEKMIHILAYQRLQQLLFNDKSKEEKNIEVHKSVPIIRSRAALSCLNAQNSHQPQALMLYRTFTIGTGDDVNLSLNNYGHCNYVSSRHACIFYDEMSKQYELLNYSEYGTAVDNVVYSCDFSEKNTIVTAPTSVVAAIRTIVDKYRGKSSFPTQEKTTMTSQPNQDIKSCSCLNTMNPGTGAGWEGTALLHHGSVIRFGCLHFVFSITESATREALLEANKQNQDKIPSDTNVPQMIAMSNSKPQNYNRES